jgi:pyruvate/2-oxoglutarate dehydrogenase complex dihydrolipoamide dehydrogenase (E3) component
MNYDLIVIGGGSAGLTATQAACRLGARVLLIDKHALGGDCLFTGCVPSKTLIRTAQLAHEMRHADRWGLGAATPSIDGARVMAHVRSVIRQFTEGEDSPAHFESLGAEVRIGAPHFVSPTELELDGQRLTARAFLIATGSRPAIPDVPGLADAHPLTNESVFDLDAIPRSLAVIGGGPVGLELGQALARLGARVTVVEMLPRILSADDPECASELRARLEAEGVVVHTATHVERVERLASGELRLHAIQSGAPVTIDAERVLVATGRRPSTDGLELARAGIDFDARRIVVDAELRTTNPRVFAAGDVAGNWLFTHTAGYEAVVAVRNALLPLATRVDYRVVPWCTFTQPEVARVGVTEAEAQKADEGGVEVFRARFADVDRARTDVEPHGFAKIVAVRGRVAGVHLVGAHAGELLHTGVLAVKEQLKVSALASMNWIYPTLSEVLRKAAQSKYERLLSRGSVQRMVGILRGMKGG